MIFNNLFSMKLNLKKLIINFIIIIFFGWLIYSSECENLECGNKKVLKKNYSQTLSDGSVKSAKSDTFSSSNNSGDADTFQPDEKNKRTEKRKISKEQREENDREFKRIAETMPDNMWVPGRYSSHQDENRKIKREIIKLENKVRRKSADDKEMKRYYELKIRETKDKIEFIEYIISRAEEIRVNTGEQKIKKSQVNRDKKSIEKMRVQLSSYKEKLAEL